MCVVCVGCDELSIGQFSEWVMIELVALAIITFVQF